MQPSKSIKNLFNYFLGPILFCWLVYAIYEQISNQPHLGEWWVSIRHSFTTSHSIYLVLVFLLLPLNWGLEALKWKESVDTVYPIRFLQAYKAVLSGVSFSVTMPNRIGEYLGRVVYLPDGNRLKTISISLVGSISQLLVTLYMGTIGFMVLRGYLVQAGLISTVLYRFVLAGLIFLVLILTLFYFQVSTVERFMERWWKNNKYLYLIQSLRAFDAGLLGRLLLFSFLRYGVFLTQYVLLFQLFEVHVPLSLEVPVMGLIFLTLAIIPSIALVEVVLRGEVSLALMGLFSTNSLGIGLTSITIWLINLIVPAIIGGLFIMNVKVFKRL